jgi:hypothetical protein
MRARQEFGGGYFVRICIAALALCACRSATFEPASFVAGLRVLAIKAEPPDLAPDASTTLTALAVDTEGRAIAIVWSVCLLVPPLGKTLHPDCLAEDAGTSVISFGTGQGASFTMPAIDLSAYGRSDTTGGFYIPILARARAGDTNVTALYQLRVNAGSATNRNPAFDNLFVVQDDGGAEIHVPLDDAGGAQNLVIRERDEWTLLPTFADGSVETYAMSNGDASVLATETLSISWFATAGGFSAERTSGLGPDVLFKMPTRADAPAHVPDSGALIDLWVVARDNRGGVDFVHRTLRFE